MLRLSLNELSKLVQSQSGESDPENIERRAWRESRPVIHLAAAIQTLLRIMGPDQEKVGYPLDNASLHEMVVQLAEFNEQIVLSDERFGVRPENLVRIRLVGRAANRAF